MFRFSRDAITCDTFSATNLQHQSRVYYVFSGDESTSTYSLEAEKHRRMSMVRETLPSIEFYPTHGHRAGNSAIVVTSISQVGKASVKTACSITGQGADEWRQS